MTLFYDDEVAAARIDADAVDLFAGPGGWDEACEQLGVRAVGLEFDRWACATRRAAGHATVECDLSHVDPLDYLGVVGLIASPPCQAFSNAGGRTGLDHVDGLVAAILARDWGYRPARDARVWLALEVGRWYESLRPEWVLLEQVPAVLPLWEAYAEVLRADGFSVWVGVLNAADYGVPQTRKRAVLIASRTRSVNRPSPTHHRDGADGLARWVSMAEGLGWGMTDRPGLTLAVGTKAGGTDPAGVGGTGARQTLYGERDAGRWVLNTGRDWKPGGTRDDAQEIPFDQPAPALTAKSGGQWQLRADDDWMLTRPATTIQGDSRVWPPGHKINADDIARLGADEAAERYGDRAGTDAIRLEIVDALRLQSFRADYPVRGGKSKQFEQVGNAIPPLLAEHVMRQVVPSNS